MILIIAWRITKSKTVQEETRYFFSRGKLIRDGGFDTFLSGLWAQRASAAPLCSYQELSTQSKEASFSLGHELQWLRYKRCVFLQYTFCNGQHL